MDFFLCVCVCYLRQAWFDKYFPQYGDVAGLDGDKDGKPCEKLLKK